MNTLVAWLMSVLMALGAAAPDGRQFDRLHQDPEPAVYPEVEIVKSDIIQIWDDEGQPASATATITFRIAARGGTIYLNGKRSVQRFVELEMYGPHYYTDSTEIVGTTYTTSAEFETVVAGGHEYYVLNEDQTGSVELHCVLYQSPSNPHPDFVGVRIKEIKFGIDESSPATRSEFVFEDVEMTEDSESGIAPIFNN